MSLRKAAGKLSLDIPLKPLVTDRWEMKSTHIDLQDIIGKGAFGQVYSAEIEASKMSPIYRQMTFKEGQKKSNQKKQLVKVAVKVLKGNCTGFILIFQYSNYFRLLHRWSEHARCFLGGNTITFLYDYSSAYGEVTS